MVQPATPTKTDKTKIDAINFLNSFIDFFSPFILAYLFQQTKRSHSYKSNFEISTYIIAWILHTLIQLTFTLLWLFGNDLGDSLISKLLEFINSLAACQTLITIPKSDARDAIEPATPRMLVNKPKTLSVFFLSLFL